MAVILRYFIEFGSFGADYVKMIEYRSMLSTAKNLVSSDIIIMIIIISLEVRNECIIDRHVRDIDTLCDSL